MSYRLINMSIMPAYQDICTCFSFSPTCIGDGRNLICTNCSQGYTGVLCERYALFVLSLYVIHLVRYRHAWAL